MRAGPGPVRATIRHQSHDPVLLSGDQFEVLGTALKHAFPNRRKGRILVDYKAGESGWTLSVSDDGAGMPPDEAAKKGDLGTGIVQALARQLGAVVEIVDANPGTNVSVVRS